MVAFLFFLFKRNKIFKKTYYYFMCMSVLTKYVSVPHTCLVSSEPEEEIGYKELDLKMVMSHHAGARN